MFEAIDEVVLTVGDEDRARRLYVDHMGFSVGARAELHDPDLARLWGCDAPVTTTLLVKEGSSGGAIRLVSVPARTEQPPRRMHTAGPFAIDFYVRDMRCLYDRLVEDGFMFRSEPQRYQLFGTSFEVDEVLLAGPEGFLHALVDYLPRQHRCVLGDRPNVEVSEVVAQVTLTEDVDASLVVLRDALGGQVYFDQVFSGVVVERLLDLPVDAAFRAVIMRGPGRRNARMEVMSMVGGPSEAPLDQPPRMFPSITVPSLAEALDRAASTTTPVETRGPVVVPEELGGGSAATVSTAAGLFVQLREPAATP